MNGMENKDGPGRPGEWLAPFAALKKRDFRYFWIGNLAIFNAFQMGMVASGWLIYTLTNAALALGIISLAWGVPTVVFSLWGGAVADRVRKRDLLLATQVGAMLAHGVITVLILLGLIQFWHLVVSAVFSGVLFAFALPARHGIIPELVEDTQIPAAVALGATAMNFCRVVSPAIAGVLLKFIGIPGVYLVTLGSYLVVVASTLMIRRGRRPVKAEGSTVLKDLFEGLSFVRSSRLIRLLLFVAFATILVGTPYGNLMPVFAKKVFAVGETGLGLLMASVGLGALCGSVLSSWLAGGARKGVLMLASGLVFGLSLVLFGVSPGMGWAMGFLFFVGLSSSTYFVATNTILISSTPPPLVGRVMSIYMITWGLQPLGVVPFSLLTDLAGARAAMVLAGLLLVAITGLMVASPGLRRLIRP